MILFLSVLVKWEGTGESLGHGVGGEGCSQPGDPQGVAGWEQEGCESGRCITGLEGPRFVPGSNLCHRHGEGGLEGAAQKREIQLLTCLVSLWEGLGQSCSVGGQAQRREEVWAGGPRPRPASWPRVLGPRPGRSLLCVLPPSRGSPLERTRCADCPRDASVRPPYISGRRELRRLFAGVSSAGGGRVPQRGAGPASPSAPLGPGGVKGRSLVPSGKGGPRWPGRGALCPPAGGRGHDRPGVGGGGCLRPLGRGGVCRRRGLWRGKPVPAEEGPAAPWGRARAALTAGCSPQVPLPAPCCSEASSGRVLTAAVGRRRPIPLLLPRR